MIPTLGYTIWSTLTSSMFSGTRGSSFEPFDVLSMVRLVAGLLPPDFTSLASPEPSLSKLLP